MDVQENRRNSPSKNPHIAAIGGAITEARYGWHGRARVNRGFGIYSHHVGEYGSGGCQTKADGKSPLKKCWQMGGGSCRPSRSLKNVLVHCRILEIFPQFILYCGQLLIRGAKFITLSLKFKICSFSIGDIFE